MFKNTKIVSLVVGSLTLCILFIAIFQNLSSPKDNNAVLGVNELSQVKDNSLIVKYKSAARNPTAQSLKLQDDENELKKQIEIQSFDSKEQLKQALKKLSTNPDVEYAQPNYKYTPLYTPTDPKFSTDQWYLKDQVSGINAESGWQKLGQKLSVTCGINSNCGGLQSVKVAVIDTGVNTNVADFAPGTFDITNSVRFHSITTNTCPSGQILSIIGNQNYCTQYGSQYDEYGHGTAVSSVISMANNGVEAVGVAPHVQILPIALHGEAFNTAFIIEGIYHAINNGAKIINLSVGTTFTDQYMKDAIDQATNLGVTIVAASGNCALKTPVQCGFTDDLSNQTNPVIYPAGFENTIAVGSSNYATTLASITKSDYSSFGSYVDLVAPVGDGSSCSGSGKCYVNGYDQNGVLRKWSGTSFAAPQVAGAAALLLSANPNYTPFQIRDLLQKTAKDVGVSGRDNQFGHGLIDVNAAIDYNPIQCAAAGNNTFCSEYYNNQYLNGSPVFSRIENSINNNWVLGSPDSSVPVDRFSARYTGSFAFNAGNYNFSVVSDDGTRVFIDDQLVFDQWGSDTNGGVVNAGFSKNMTAGNHSVRVEYREIGGGARVVVGW